MSYRLNGKLHEVAEPPIAEAQGWIRGRRQGKLKRISSRDAQIKHSGPNDDHEAEAVLKILVEGFSKTLRRLL